MPSWRSRTTCWSPTFRTIPISRASFGAISPAPIVERFPDALTQHRLRREIIATQLANSIINRGGPQFVVRIEDQTGASAASIATAFAAVRDSYGMTALNTEIDGLDNKIAGGLQLDLYAAVQRLLRDRVVWFLRNVDLTKGLAAHRHALSRRHRRRGGGARRALTAEAKAARDEPRQRNLRLPACRPISRAGSPACRR